ncbi:uncharacterized protein LOC125553449 [Triticum urartu]|uniref:uncharacterized protein LOC125553449 n=1 Tax=Triticum urartu TaxID=4572 RepID=UPI002044525D|nr:uncharacterized protein LOC125553449 [Triticum urartu]
MRPRRRPPCPRRAYIRRPPPRLLLPPSTCFDDGADHLHLLPLLHQPPLPSSTMASATPSFHRAADHLRRRSPPRPPPPVRPDLAPFRLDLPPFLRDLPRAAACISSLLCVMENPPAVCTLRLPEDAAGKAQAPLSRWGFVHVACRQTRTTSHATLATSISRRPTRGRGDRGKHSPDHISFILNRQHRTHFWFLFQQQPLPKFGILDGDRASLFRSPGCSSGAGQRAHSTLQCLRSHMSLWPRKRWRRGSKSCFLGMQ